MQFLSISQPRKGFAEGDYASLAEQEMERARELYSEGFIRQIWHRLDMVGVFVMGGRWRRAGSRNVGYIAVLLRLVRRRCRWFSVKPYAGFRPAKPPKI